MRKKLGLRELSGAQREIMEILWRHKELSASQVREILIEKRNVAKNTVRTLLERMKRKGWLTHRQEGRTFLYSTACTRESSIAEKVIQVLDGACGGSPVTLVTAILDSRGLTQPELDQIREMLNRVEKKGSNGMQTT